MLELAHPVRHLAFSPAGDLAVASGQDVWLVAGERPVKLPIGDDVECVAFRDARTLAIAGKTRGISIVEFGIELGGKPRVTRIEMECGWHTMLWSPDGKYIVGGQYEPWVSVIDVEARAELRVLDPDEFDDSGRTAMLFAGATLYTTAYNKLVRWRFADVIAGKAKCRMPKTGVTGHAHLLDLVAMPDGVLVALAEVEGHEAYLQKFAPTGEKLGKRVAVDASTWRLAALGDSIVVSDSEGTRILDGDLLDDTISEVRALAAHGNRLAIGGSALRVIQR